MEMRSLFTTFGLIILCCMLAALSIAQPVVSVEPNPTIEGMTFQVVVKHSQPFEMTTQPSVSDKSIKYMGSSSTSNITIRNGRHLAEYITKYSYRADAEGLFTIGPFDISSSTEKYKIEPVKVEVTPVPTMTKPGLGEIGLPLALDRQLDQYLAGKVFTGLQAPESVYVNQAFELRTDLYYNIQSPLANVEMSKEPSGQQFLAIQSDKLLTRSENVMLDGASVIRIPAFRSIVIPTRSGETEIEGGEIRLSIETGEFFNPYISFVISEPKRNIIVKPLPPLPEGVFTQVVGNVSIGASVDRTEVKNGELITIETRLSGEGYLKSISLPEQEEIPGLIFIDEETDFTINQVSPLVTTKVFKKVYQAGDIGKIVIPEQQFAVFNPQTEKQVVKSTQSFEIEVVSDDSSSVQITSDMETIGRGKAKQIGNNIIQYVKVPEISKEYKYVKYTPYYRRPVVLGLHLLAFVAVLIAGTTYAIVQSKEGDEAFRNKRNAKNRAEKLFAELNKNSYDLSQEEYYNLLETCLLAFIALKLNRSPNGLQKDEAIENLHDGVLSSETIEKLQSLLEKVDSYRYAPSNNAEDRKVEITMCSEVIRALHTEVTR